MLPTRWNLRQPSRPSRAVPCSWPWLWHYQFHPFSVFCLRSKPLQTEAPAPLGPPAGFNHKLYNSRNCRFQIQPFWGTRRRATASLSCIIKMKSGRKSDPGIRTRGPVCLPKPSFRHTPAPPNKSTYITGVLHRPKQGLRGNTAPSREPDCTSKPELPRLDPTTLGLLAPCPLSPWLWRLSFPQPRLSFPQPRRLSFPHPQTLEHVGFASAPCRAKKHPGKFAHCCCGYEVGLTLPTMPTQIGSTSQTQPKSLPEMVPTHGHKPTPSLARRVSKRSGDNPQIGSLEHTPPQVWHSIQKNVLGV